MNKEVTMNLENLPPVVGIDLGGTQLRVAVLRGAELLSRVSVSTGEDSTPKRIIPRIYRTVQQALEEANMTLEQVMGIGIGIAGPLDSQTGVVFASPNLVGWDHVPVYDIFKEHYDKPVFVENDANVAALGEYMFGAGRGCKNLIYLTISTGIGGSAITDGQILRGTSGTAAELGHMTIDWHGERCNCGNIGCLESIASGTAIARRAHEAIARGMHFPGLTSEGAEGNAREGNTAALLSHIDAKAVAQEAEAGVPIACDIIRDAAEAIGVGLVNIIHIFNPEMIILGGGVTQIGPSLIEPALQVVQQRAMKVPSEAAHISLAKLGADVGLIGAGALVYCSKEKRNSEVLSNICQLPANS
jgi:glucokinase